MGYQLRCILVLLVQASMVSWVAAATCNETVADAFGAYNIVDDVGTAAPCDPLELTFPNGVEVSFGNELTPTQVAVKPSNSPRDPGGPEYSTLMFFDPDYTDGEFNHWLVGNIPNGRVSEGEDLAEFIRSGPAEDSGLHRYIFYLFGQPGKLVFDETRLTNTSIDGRAPFSAKEFAEKYNLGSPLAGNFYRAQYDESVDQLYEELGIA